MFAAVSCSRKQPANRQDREKWNRATLNGSYQTAGHANSKWDGDAQEALADFAKSKIAADDEMEVLTSLTGDAAESAVKAGCDDPMIRYLYAKFSSPVKAMPLKEKQDLFHQAANDLQGSSYPPLRKFYANLDAAQILWARRDTNLWSDVCQCRDSAINNLTDAVRDPALPEAEAFHAAKALFELLSRNTSQLTNAYNQLTAAMSSAGIKSATPNFVEAVFYDTYAWKARGHGTADTVSKEAWNQYFQRLGQAEKALTKAYSRDPMDSDIPTEMISIVLGEQKERPEMEKWFARAMKADPKNYRACLSKLNYLAPRWYGSRQAMLEFGRECVTNTNWSGQVPLTLVEAHRDFYRSLSREDREGYWAYPDVWPDIKAGYERFGQANPEETHFRYPYAWYAFSCGQMEDFKEQIKIIRQNERGVRYNYFGGQEEFNKMEAIANGKAASTNSVPTP